MLEREMSICAELVCAGTGHTFFVGAGKGSKCARDVAFITGPLYNPESRTNTWDKSRGTPWKIPGTHIPYDGGL